MNVFASEVYTDYYGKRFRTTMDKWFKKCPICGKEFHVANESIYPLKAYSEKGSYVFLKNRVVYFNTKKR